MTIHSFYSPRAIGVLLGMLGAITCHAVWGDVDASYMTEEDLVSELALVNGPTRMAQPITMAPSSVTIIDRELIELSGAQTWADVFRLVPGAHPYSVNGNRLAVSYHGLGREFPNHLEVMVDGRSVYNPLFSTVEWGGLGLDLRDIDHIEIVRGPNAPSHGSNAFLGAINIITRKPVQDRGLAMHSTDGSLSTRDAFVRYNHSLADLDYRISLGYRHNEGFPAVATGAMEDGQELFQTDFRGTYTPNTSDIVELHFGYSNYRYGFGDPDHPDDYTPADFVTQFQSIKWQHNPTPGSDLQLHLYHNRFNGKNNVPVGLLSELMSTEIGISVDTAIAILNGLGVSDGPITLGFREVFSERYDIELEHSVALSRNLRGVWGLGVRDEAVEAESLLYRNNPIDQMSYRLFGHLEWRPNQRWVFNAGAMVEKNGLVGAFASPRVAANYLFNNNHSLRLTLARGNRSPSLLEANEFNLDQHDGLLLEAIRRTAPDVSEEKIESIELGYVATYPEQGLSLDIRAFHEQVKDGFEQYHEDVIGSPFFSDLLIVLPDRVAVRDNLANWTMNGVELQLRYQPSAAMLIAGFISHVSLQGGYMKRLAPQTFIQLDDNTPANTSALLISRQLAERFNASVTLLYQDSVYWREASKRPLDSITRADARLSYDFALGKTSGSIALVAQNIGATYADFHFNNHFDSRYYVQLELQLP